MPKNETATVETVEPVTTGKTRSYSIVNPRWVKPSGKVATNNPDVILMAKGEFHAIKADGSVDPEPLTFSSLPITRDLFLHPLTVIDRVANTLTLPAGDRGRKASAGMSGDDLDAYLASIRDAASDEAASADSVTADEAATA